MQAGRVGVHPSQVTVDGMLRIPQTPPYELPVYHIRYNGTEEAFVTTAISGVTPADVASGKCAVLCDIYESAESTENTETDVVFLEKYTNDNTVTGTLIIDSEQHAFSYTTANGWVIV